MANEMLEAAIALCKIAFALIVGGVSLIIIVCIIILLIALATVAITTIMDSLDSRKREKQGKGRNHDPLARHR